MSTGLHEQYRNNCKIRGIKIVKDRFGSNDENLKKEIEMLEEYKNRTFVQKIDGHWGELTVKFLMPITVLVGLVLIYN